MFKRSLPTFMIAASLSFAAVSLTTVPAHAGNADPSAEEMRNAIAKLLKLNEMMDPKPQPLKHTTIGEPQAPQPPTPPQVSAPQVSPPTPPQQGGLQTAANDQPPSSKPHPVNPGAKGTPLGGGASQGGDSSGASGGGNLMKGLLPDFGEALNKPKPKSKLKQVSPPAPLYKKNGQEDGDEDENDGEHEDNGAQDYLPHHY